MKLKKPGKGFNLAKAFFEDGIHFSGIVADIVKKPYKVFDERFILRLTNNH